MSWSLNFWIANWKTKGSAKSGKIIIIIIIIIIAISRLSTSVGKFRDKLGDRRYTHLKACWEVSNSDKEIKLYMEI